MKVPEKPTETPSPGVVLAVGEPGAVVPPLLADRGLVGGQPAAYVCRGFVCQLPTTDPARLVADLGPAAPSSAAAPQSP